MPTSAPVVVDCHAFGLYPYVGCNELMVRLFPEIRRDDPGLIREFVRSLVVLAPDTHAGALDACPDLIDIVGEPGDIPFTPGQRDEGLFPADRTTWLAHGVASLILRWRAGRGNAASLRLTFTNVAAADPLQKEFIAILERRADPSLVQVVRHNGDPNAGAGGHEGAAPRMSAEEHRIRAEELAAQKRRSAELSGILHHLERSNAPAGTVLRAFTAAAEHYLAVGFYKAALHTARTAARYAEPGDAGTAYTLCLVTVNALMQLDRLDEAEEFCLAQASTEDDHLVQMICAYSRAVMRARLRPAGHRDYAGAASLAELAMAHLDRLPESPRQIGSRIFLTKNFRALMEFRANRPDEALRLLAEGLTDIRRLCPERHQAESPIFFQNQARVYALLTQFGAAISSYSEAIALEPFSAGLHVNRGNAHEAIGDHRAALRDYRMALAAGPPRPQTHFNAALAHAALGEDDQALVEYGYALELDPAYLPARSNLVALHYRAGRLAEASRDIELGLSFRPQHPDLLCARGLVKVARHDLDGALADFTAALAGDPAHPAALKNRCSVWFAKGDVPNALRDADRCVEIRPDADALMNRGFLHQALGSWQRALADYNRAARHDGVHQTELARRRGACIHALMDEKAGIRS